MKKVCLKEMTLLLACFGLLPAATYSAEQEAAEDAESVLEAGSQSTPELGSVELVKAGEARFYQNCVYCHGARGIGGSSKKLQCRDLDPDYLFDVVTNGLSRGNKVMPPWGDTFNESERWELVAYIASLKTLESCA